MTWAAVAIAGAAVVGAGASVYASNQQQAGQQNAINTQQGMFNTVAGIQSPFVNAGTTALSTLMGGLGGGGPIGQAAAQIKSQFKDPYMNGMSDQQVVNYFQQQAPQWLSTGANSAGVPFAYPGWQSQVQNMLNTVKQTTGGAPATGAAPPSGIQSVAGAGGPGSMPGTGVVNPNGTIGGGGGAGAATSAFAPVAGGSPQAIDQGLIYGGGGIGIPTGGMAGGGGGGSTAGGIAPGQFTSSFTPTDFLSNLDPGYGFQLQQGGAAIRNQDTPGVGALSGPALKDLMTFNQGLASTGYQNAYNRWLTTNNAIFGRLSGIAGLGANVATGVGTQGVTLGTGIAQAQAAQGGAAAGGTVGAANALGNSSIPLAYLMSNQNPNTQQPGGIPSYMSTDLGAGYGNLAGMGGGSSFGGGA